MLLEKIDQSDDEPLSVMDYNIGKDPEELKREEER